MTTFKPVVEGSTARRGPFTARVDGVPHNLTGYELPTIHFVTGLGAEVAEPGVVVLRTPQATYPGQWYHDPVAGTFTRTSGVLFDASEDFGQRLEVLDADGKPKHFPEGERDRVPVYAR